MKPAISVHNLSKQYRIGTAPTKGNNLTENLRRQARTAWDKVSRLVSPNKEFEKDESFWALKDVSFEVQPGEVVGIIGRNGAGKSTLLKILSQIVEPTSGYADIRGRMGSLLEVGTGFHPELTGRENIYLNGAILGMKREEITKKFNEIVAFAEVEKFLDTPVKRYSSGMYVRLAFSVAAHLEPEILIVDEVLAVGDAAFQDRCLGQMQQTASHGRTILFVSHNMSAIRQLCSRIIFLDKGKLLLDGLPSETIRKYYTNSRNMNTNNLADSKERDETASGEARILALSLSNLQQQESDSFSSGDSLKLNMKLHFHKAVYNPSFGFLIQTLTGEPILDLRFSDNSNPPGWVEGLINVTAVIRKIGLYPGEYHVSPWVAHEDDRKNIDWVKNASVLLVTLPPHANRTLRSTGGWGKYWVQADWNIETAQHIESLRNIE